MYDTTESVKKAMPPMTAVSDGKGAFGYIKEVSINSCQPDEYQLSYSVNWLIGSSRNAWWHHEELTFGENIMLSICDAMQHPFGSSKIDSAKLFK